jgi:outer membrane biosynthesis protein TonB
MTESLGLSHALALLLTGIMLIFPFQDYSLRVDSAVAPVYPARAHDGGVAVIGIQADRAGRRTSTEMISGEAPFVTAALDILAHWKFAPSSTAGVSATSITFVFRPRTMDRVPLYVSISEHQKAKADRPPLPLQIFDTGYPQMCIDQGAVIMELSVNERGDVEDVKSILSIPSLGGAAEMEVKSWKFYPAMSGGKPVRGQAVVVISFVHPAL